MQSKFNIMSNLWIPVFWQGPFDRYIIQYAPLTKEIESYYLHHSPQRTSGSLPCILRVPKDILTKDLL